MNREEFAPINTSPAAIRAGYQTAFSTLTGRTLHEGQPEQMVFDVAAYRETMAAESFNETMRQNVLAFATGTALDFMGEFVGVVRLPASGAITTLTFIGNGGNTAPVLIRSGTRVSTDDGQAVFETTADAILEIAAAGVSVEAACTTLGELGNGAALTQLLDPYGFVVGFTAATPSGGSNGETDEGLRERIFLAPNSFSVAGPANAYKFFAQRAHPSIIDVAVTTPKPGVVRLFPLVAGGVASQLILDTVEAACNPDDIRPICDNVQVRNPTVVNYTISAALTLYAGTSGAAATATVTALLNAYAAERASGLGRDIVREQIIARAMAAGVYGLTLSSPAASVVVPPTGVAICANVTVTIAGYTNG